MKINILGQDYDYQEIAAKEDLKLSECDGYCDGYGKIIRINNDYNANCPMSVSDISGYINKVKRHEIVHAFLDESGLEKYKNDELIVDWISKQFPKMMKVFSKVGAL